MQEPFILSGAGYKEALGEMVLSWTLKVVGGEEMQRGKGSSRQANTGQWKYEAHLEEAE